MLLLVFCGGGWHGFFVLNKILRINRIFFVLNKIKGIYRIGRIFFESLSDEMIALIIKSNPVNQFNLINPVQENLNLLSEERPN